MVTSGTSRKPTIGIIGLGFWGEKLLRVCRELELRVTATDADPKRRSQIQKKYPDIRWSQNAEALFRDPGVDACIIATPPLSHFSLAYKALRSNKHVFIEKPMTQDAGEAKRLVSEAKKHARVIMVDHIYLFSPLVVRVKRVLQTKRIGQIRQIHSVRSVGRIHPGSSVLWDLAPHDISVVSHILNSMPTKARTMAIPAKLAPVLTDAIYELTYQSGVVFRSHLSWYSPVKKRSMEIIGDHGALLLTWDNGTETLDMYKRTKTTVPLYTKYTSETIKSREEPMKTMLCHFLACITSELQPISGGQEGYIVTSIIASLHNSWKKNGAVVPIRHGISMPPITESGSLRKYSHHSTK